MKGFRRMSGLVGGYGVVMQRSHPPDDRDDLWQETLWSLGLLAVVASIIVLLSVLGPG
jgi:hypothetical protein